MQGMKKLLVFLLATVCAVITTSSSHAHSQITASYPAANSNVNPIPQEVWIEFNGTLQTLDGQGINSIEVIDSTGIAVNFDTPIIDGPRITTKISSQSALGVFTVNYRIVSEDGHPVKETYSFTATPDYVESEIARTAAPESDSSLSVGGALLVVFLIVFAVGILLKRKNEK